MKLVTGKVVGGRIELEGEPLSEGSTVTVIAQEEDETFELSSRDEAELSLRIQDIQKGRFVDGDELLDALARQ